MKAIMNSLFADKGKKLKKAVIAVLALGICFLLYMRFFGQKTEVQPRAPDAAPSAVSTVSAVSLVNTGKPEIEIRMEEILSMVEGAGTTRVLIHTAKGSERVYARNTTHDESTNSETDSNGGTREQKQAKTESSVVTLGRREGGDEPLMLYENTPIIEGVIIVAEGGGDIVVRDALIRAASGLLGVAVHKITVLPMARDIDDK